MRRSYKMRIKNLLWDMHPYGHCIKPAMSASVYNIVCRHSNGFPNKELNHKIKSGKSEQKYNIGRSLEKEVIKYPTL